ncbi:SDR family oxidoreductase [Mesorhizobium sp. CO1-1-8]|uniref:SDR family oxidoreductase n=1 Tax=Mesorhizobium sp. CO1-1-8 TaxID=2876631 RepID=UPI001CD0CA90|nr:SDR family oxidoreductase [Mesorhizobium sp. CO1-1-8]MBZ9771653.1 SDR family oxidoreductase [Mesorhizobium sp. CO1-1-8]
MPEPSCRRRTSAGIRRGRAPRPSPAGRNSASSLPPTIPWRPCGRCWAIAATRAMAVELAPFGIRVNAMNPVAVDTLLLSTFIGSGEENRARVVATIPSLSHSA